MNISLEFISEENVINLLPLNSLHCLMKTNFNFQVSSHNLNQLDVYRNISFRVFIWRRVILMPIWLYHNQSLVQFYGQYTWLSRLVAIEHKSLRSYMQNTKDCGRMNDVAVRCAYLGFSIIWTNNIVNRSLMHEMHQHKDVFVRLSILG